MRLKKVVLPAPLGPMMARRDLQMNIIDGLEAAETFCQPRAFQGDCVRLDHYVAISLLLRDRLFKSPRIPLGVYMGVIK